jgi:hypothetical protein
MMEAPLGVKASVVTPVVSRSFLRVSVRGWATPCINQWQPSARGGIYVQAVPDVQEVEMCLLDCPNIQPNSLYKEPGHG